MSSYRVVPLLLLLALVPVEAAADAPAPSAPVIAIASSPKTHPVGDLLFVEWRGSWWKAKTVYTLPDSRLVITYVGWSDDYDEVVKRKRVRNAVAGPATFTVGEAVFVEWKGSFWAAHISKLPSAGQYAIHYDGWTNQWDETVGPTRIRRLSPPEN